MDYPKISVVTVCFNAVNEIEETMLSVLDQTYDNVEYIIIDGGSTDGTVDIIKKYAEGGCEYGKHNNKISYWVSEPDRGIYDAMNKGIDIASGEYINFMNTGDKFFNNDVIKKIVLYVDDAVIVIYGDTIVKRIDKLKFVKCKKAKYLKYNNAFCHQSAFISSKYHKLNKYDFIKYKIGADYDFFHTIYLNGKHFFKKIPYTISIYNLANNGFSSTNCLLFFKERLEIIKNDAPCYYVFFIKIRRSLGDIKHKILKFLNLVRFHMV